MAGDYPIPYLDRCLMHHPYTHRRQDIDWRENRPFDATMKIGDIRSGRSAKYVMLIDEQGSEHPMFVAELVRCAKDFGIQKGVIRGTWKVRKRGQNYGLELVDATHTPERAGEDDS